MTSIIVLTKWDSSTGANLCDVAERYPGEWTDITGQRDDQLPLDLNVVVWQGEVDAATLTALEADPALVVLYNGAKPAGANPSAAERGKMTAALTAAGVTGTDRAALVRAGVSRKTIADDIRAWAKERPKAT